MASNYKRFVLNSTGQTDLEDMTANEAAEKDQIEAATTAAAADDFGRRLKRYQAFRQLVNTANGTGQLAPIAAAILRLQRLDPADPDPGPPTQTPA